MKRITILTLAAAMLIMGSAASGYAKETPSLKPLDEKTAFEGNRHHRRHRRGGRGGRGGVWFGGGYYGPRHYGGHMRHYGGYYGGRYGPRYRTYYAPPTVYYSQPAPQVYYAPAPQCYGGGVVVVR